jgi:hypothetical protein
LRHAALALIIVLISLSAVAAEPGRAEGAVTIDKTKVDLAYAYAIGHQRNEITKRKDDIKVVLTDKALDPALDLNEIDTLLPADVHAMVFSVASSGKVTHVSLLYPKGSYDGGFLEDTPDFRFKNSNPPRGNVAGRISSGRIQTNTMTFQVDADFNAAVK